MPKARSVAENYHRITKYSEQNLRSGPGLDWSRQPDQFKDIVSSQRVSLRFSLPAKGGVPQPQRNGELGIARIGRLLFYSNGVTGVIRYQSGGSQLLRASPSAGALYPTEIYLALRDMDGVEAGLYNYQVRTHELVRLWDGDQFDAIQEACGGDPALDQAQACVLMTGVYWRSAWRYQERGYRRVLLDTGHVLSNLMAYAPHEGCAVHPMLGFCDGALNGLFFFDDAEEGTLAAAALLEEEAAPVCAPLWTSQPVQPGAMEAHTILDEGDLEQSASVALHRASGCAGVLPVRPDRAPPSVSEGSIELRPPGHLPEGIPNAIVQRRSARSYTGESVTLNDLGRALGYAFGRDGSACFGTREAGMLQAHVAVHDLEGLEGGLYLVEGRGEALRCIRTGDLRQEFFHLSLGQEIARTCAAALVLTAPARPAIELWGDRAYRHLHLEAGILGERLQLGAGSLGLGACGIAGFLDDEAAASVGIGGDDFVLYLVTIGHV